MEKEKRSCAVCGKDISEKRKEAIYCSKKCREAAFMERHPPMDKDEAVCRYNANVICYRQACSQCGWNPVVERRRKEAQAWQLKKLMLMHS